MILSDIGGQPLLVEARHQQVGPIGHGVSVALFSAMTCSDISYGSRDCADWVLQHAGEVLVAEQFLPIPSIRDRNKTADSTYARISGGTVAAMHTS